MSWDFVSPDSSIILVESEIWETQHNFSFVLKGFYHRKIILICYFPSKFKHKSYLQYRKIPLKKIIKKKSSMAESLKAASKKIGM